MPELQLFLVDAFASKFGEGNPAAVALLTETLTADVCQRIAAEMNQSETAFVEPLGEDGSFQSSSHFSLRWFTPVTEVPMCGHATLASAAVLFQELRNPHSTLHFQTCSGVLEVQKEQSDDVQGQKGAIRLRMKLPLAYTTDPLPPPLNSGLDHAKAQQLLCACVGNLKVSEVVFSNTNNLAYLLLRLEDGTSRQDLEAIQPDFQAMSAAASNDDVHGIIVTCKDVDGEYDFLSRFFAPWMGIPEDPVTGSAHSVLGPFWRRRLGGKGAQPSTSDGRKDAGATIQPMLARQCSQRGGALQVYVQDGLGHVLLVGPAAIVLRGSLHV